MNQVCVMNADWASIKYELITMIPITCRSTAQKLHWEVLNNSSDRPLESGRFQKCSEGNCNHQD